MNELISRDRGVLVSAGAGVPMNFGYRYQVETAALEMAMAEVFAWSREARLAMGQAARQWFVENHRRFCHDFSAVLRDVAITRLIDEQE